MSLVTWSPAIGIDGRVADRAAARTPRGRWCRRRCRPGTRRAPSRRRSARRSSRRAARARCRRPASPQRCTHFTMFCAALSAPVTMCTLASRRTPDMPIGSRMPSWLSMMNSCGRMCRIFWSAGIATALRRVDARGRRRPASLRLSRIATMPCELRLRTWLPAIAGVHRVDLAAGHQLGFLDRALDRLHGRFDVDDDALLEAARGMRADADHLDARRRA